MNVAVKSLKIVAAMSDHRSRERGHRLRINFDWSRREKLVLRSHRQTLIARRLFSNETDVAAALDAALLYLGDIVVTQIQAHVLFDIVGRDMVTPHGVQNEIAIFDNYFRETFDQATEPMRVKGNKGEETMEQNEHQSATEGREKCGAAVDRAREH